jgi:hypothetical protein
VSTTYLEFASLEHVEVGYTTTSVIVYLFCKALKLEKLNYAIIEPNCERDAIEGTFRPIYQNSSGTQNSTDYVRFASKLQN